MKKLKSGFLTLLGLPNAGKSTLLNALVGEPVSIVTPKPQTTWKNIRGFLAKPDLEVVIIDTPGIQEGTKALNQAIYRNSIQALKSATEDFSHEMIALVLDAAACEKALEHSLEHWLQSSPFKAIENTFKNELKLPIHLRLLPIFHKSDQLSSPQKRKQIEERFMGWMKQLFSDVEDPLWISSRTSEGIENLTDRLKQALPEGDSGSLFDPEAWTDQTLREMAVECIRETCFFQLGAELPYSIAVQIEEYQERENGLHWIQAVLHVERDSQKGILLGRHGQKIKAIGQKSREKIEKITQAPVYLGLKVKVTPDWSKQERWIQRFGYATTSSSI